MTDRPSVVEELRRILKEDPRMGIALLEALGPPPGLTSPKDGAA